MLELKKEMKVLSATECWCCIETGSNANVEEMSDKPRIVDSVRKRAFGIKILFQN